MFVGCDQGPKAYDEHARPHQTDTDFNNLPTLLSGIQEHGEVLLYEGLPHDFWEAELLQSELRRKKTLKLHGYPFYEELLVLKSDDAEQLTTFFSDRTNFLR